MFLTLAAASLNANSIHNVRYPSLKVHHWQPSSLSVLSKHHLASLSHRFGVLNPFHALESWTCWDENGLDACVNRSLVIVCLSVWSCVLLAFILHWNQISWSNCPVWESKCTGEKGFVLTFEPLWWIMAAMLVHPRKPPGPCWCFHPLFWFCPTIYLFSSPSTSRQGNWLREIMQTYLALSEISLCLAHARLIAWRSGAALVVRLVELTLKHTRRSCLWTKTFESCVLISLCLPSIVDPYFLVTTPTLVFDGAQLGIGWTLGWQCWLRLI